MTGGAGSRYREAWIGLTVRCPQCRQENPSEAKFCLECGHRLPAGCEACGRPLPVGARFCMECGAPAGATARAEPPGAPEAYTPRHLAEKILATRTALEGERKSVTVLFCDVVRSTTLAEELGAEGMHTLLSRFFETALAEVHRYEGTINQFLGDGFMALFGAPIAHEDHARRAALAALGIRRTLEERPLEIAPGRPVPLRLRLGLHTGFVVVGAIGDNLRMDYTAVGDTTHLAARLQQMAEPGGILASEATARLVRGYVGLEPRGAVAVRGLSAPVSIHAVTGPGERRSPLEAPGERPLSHFVGRDRELRSLRDLLAEVEAGRGQVVGIVGEPGVGKSRLVLELQHALAGRPSLYLEGRCLSFGGAIPYVPVHDIVRALCQVSDADPPEAARIAALGMFAEIGLDATATPFLLGLLGVKTADDLPAGLSPEAIQARTFAAFRQAIIRASRRRPIVLAVEDLHWIDRTSEECLASLVESLAGVPVMLLTTYRPGYRPSWLDRSYATQLSLARLQPADSLSVVRSILPQAAPGDPLAKLILDKAEGNPFFLEELARAVDDHDLARPGLTVPDTVHGVLAARIDRLAELPKRLLQTASVLGREFSLRLLVAVWEGDPPEAHLRELTRQEFLYERSGAEEPTFVFKHALTQDVALASILAPRRREVHARAAAALGALYPSRQAELEPLLAHHYFHAEAWTPACEHATRAAENARAAFANREALERYDQALVAGERAGLAPAQRLALLTARGRVHGALGAFDSARADLEAALAVARDIADAGACAALLGELGELWGGHRDYPRGLELTQEAVRTAEAAGDRRATAEALLRTGLMHLNLAQIAQSQRELERALAIFEQLSDERGSARTIDVLAMTDGLTARIERCIEREREALRRFQRLGDRPAQPSVISNIGFWLAFAGRRAEALPLVRQGLQSAIELGARADEAYAHVSTGWVLEQFGALGAALRESLTALELARRIGHREWTAVALAMSGRITRVCGAPTRARLMHDEMLATTRELGTALWISSALAELGEDLIALGQADEGERSLHEAIATAGEATQFVLPALLALSELKLGQGLPTAALELARRAEDAAGDYVAWRLHARRLCGDVWIAQGREEQGEALLRAIRASAATAGLDPVVWRTGLDLAALLDRRRQAAEAAGLRAEVRAALDGVAADLPADLQAAFAAGSLMRRAQGD
ncbi:MAG TPA: AAA family ATPase [Methylomirabilota bacterium]|nr:AAA family ATPase [Methylomirabilota bacterium]